MTKSFVSFTDSDPTPQRIDLGGDTTEFLRGDGTMAVPPGTAGADDQTAAEVPFTPAGTIAATDVQAAIAELDGDVGVVAGAISGHLADTSDAHDASAISFTPTGSVAATDVQAAIAEVAAEAGAGTSVATDGIWATAGDIAVATGNDAAAVLPIGAAGGHLSRINGAVAWDSGTSNPGSAAAGDRYWRTDLGLEIYFDGTRWLSTQRILIPINTPHASALDLTATATAFGRWTAGDEFDLWLIEWTSTIYVVTTNDGTKYWNADLRKVDHDDGSSSSVAAFNTSADSPDVFMTKRVAIGALLGVASNFESGFVSYGKVSTAGNCRGLVGQIVARYVIP